MVEQLAQATDFIEPKMLFRTTDLKQWVYCARVLYYMTHLPDVRPTTYKMQAGIEAGVAEEGREERRSLRAYGVQQGRREFSVPVESSRLSMTGIVDMVVFPEDVSSREKAGAIIPVDYKLSRSEGEHFKLQLAAYAVMLEEQHGETIKQGFLYFIPLRKAQAVAIDARLRKKLSESLEQMWRIVDREWMPWPTRYSGRCMACEFRRFCNDR